LTNAILKENFTKLLFDFVHEIFLEIGEESEVFQDAMKDLKREKFGFKLRAIYVTINKN